MNDDPFAAARGIVNGVAISIALVVVVILLAGCGQRPPMPATDLAGCVAWLMNRDRLEPPPLVYASRESIRRIPSTRLRPDAIYTPAAIFMRRGVFDVGLLAHEYAHHYGADERTAERVQRQAVTWCAP